MPSHFFRFSSPSGNPGLLFIMTIHTDEITNAGSALSVVIYGFIYLFLITIQIPYRLFVSSIALPHFLMEISSTVEALISMHLPHKQNALMRKLHTVDVNKFKIRDPSL